MLRPRSPYDRWLLFVLDALLWGLAMWTGLWLRFRGGVPPLEVEFFWRFVPLAGGGMLLALLYGGAYEREVADRVRLRDYLWGWSLGMGLAAGLLFLLKIPYSRLAFLVGSILFLVVSAAVHRLTDVFPGRWDPPRVCGVGFEDPSRRRELRESLASVDLTFEDRADLDPAFERLSEARPDLILLEGSAFSPRELNRFVDFGSRRQIPVRIVPDSGQTFLAGTRLVAWQDRYLLRSRTHHQLHQQLALKTLFDYVMGGVLLLVSLPVQGFVALAIRLTDGSPVLYRQARTGRGGEPFTLYKFRTMVPDADEVGPPLTQGADDPRITPLGRVLRRWSLDELPQLFNVMKGDMSLVGPRPEIPSITRDYDPEDRRLFWLKPGLTGLSQVTGRQSLGLDEKLATDQYYLTEYSLLLDLWILVRTAAEVVRGEGAA